MTNHILLSYFREPTLEHFSRLVESEQRAVFGAAWRVLGDREAAEDVTQELFMRVLDADWGKQEIRDGRGFLLSKTIGLARTRLRGDRRRQRREEVAAADERLEMDVASGAMLREVRDAVLELPEGPRKCVELRYFGGLKSSEIAEQLGCALRTVNERLQAARERLRGRLSAHSVALLIPLLENDLAPPAVEPTTELGFRLEALAETALGTNLVAVSTGVVSYVVAGLIALALAVAGALYVRSESAPAELATPASPSTQTALAADPRTRAALETQAGKTDAEVRVDSPAGEIASVQTGLRIRVRDEDGQAIVGATLHIRARKLSTLGAVLRLEERDVSAQLAGLLDPVELSGESEFFIAGFPEVLCGLPFEVCGLASGFATPAPQSFVLTANETTELELRLPRPRRAELRIVDSITAEPISGAVAFSVTELERRDLDPADVWQLEGPGRASSDAAGKAWIEGLGAGQHEIEVVEEGYGLVVLRDHEPGELVEVRLVRAPVTGSILVRVQDPIGDPIVDFEVVVCPVAANSEFRARTDENGVATFADLSPDWYEAKLPVMPFAQLRKERGYASSGEHFNSMAMSEELLAGEELHLTLGFLPGTASWDVLVLGGNGEPLANEEVSLNGPVHVSHKTDAGGRCQFDHLPAGSWDLSVGSVFESFRFERPPLEEGENRLDKIILGSARVEGRIVLAEEGAEPPASAFVMLIGDCVTSTHAGPDGTFRFERIPAGEYRLSCIVSGYAASRDSIRVAKADSEVSVEVQMQRGGSVLVNRSSAWAIPGSTLELRGPAGEELILEAIDRDSKCLGSPKLEPGVYTVRATAAGQEPFAGEVVIENGSDTELTLD